MTGRNSKSKSTARAASPIIGVVLLVGLTIILSAVVAVYALEAVQDHQSQAEDLQPWDEEAPDTSFDIERIGGDVLVTHAGGESINARTLEIHGDLTNTKAQFDGQTITDGDSVTAGLRGENATVRIEWATSYNEETLAEAVV
ncbi:type IV pilin [Natronorubrum sp. FCH18a]|uniref:type IV pilin n=1 Tax=Natronorubrum sp. FCH18a TaxID=3447018 RepID=UPI003F50EE64